MKLLFILLLLNYCTSAQVIHKYDTLYVNVIHLPDNTEYKAFIEVNTFADSSQFIWWVPNTPLNDTTIFYGTTNIDSLMVNGLNHYVNSTKDTVIFSTQ